MAAYVKKSYRDTMVYCPTVPDGIFLTRRNGKTWWTGNSSRDIGQYTVDEMPAKGPEGKAKRVGSLDVNALLSHGAIENLKDVFMVRGNSNEDFWNAVKLGRPLPAPDTPFVYKKFINLLKAGGINVKGSGGVQTLASMTDGDVEKMSNGDITNSDTVDAHSLKEKTGGLFDPEITGGSTGKKWSSIPLAEPMPNPVMEEPIKKLLGLTGSQYMDILSGRASLAGKTGGTAIKSALANINVDEAMKTYRDDISHKRGAARDKAVKNLRYLNAVKKTGVSPADWVISRVPVIPPVFRPISQMGDTLLVADLNDLYRDVIETNTAVKELKPEVDNLTLSDDVENLYNAVKGVYGWGEPVSQEARTKGLKGAVRQIIGESPKRGLAQSKVFSKTVDTVGRGVITPDPELDMDTVGVPEKMAWNVFGPFVQRRLVRRGLKPIDAAERVKNKDKLAKEALLKEMEDRPVLFNRAPSWHKFNIMAFDPVLVDDDTIHLSPLVTSGFNADFDGDQANVHVPVSEKAVNEARDRMMPSRNLFSTTDLKSIRHPVAKEMLMGLYQMTKDMNTRKQPVVFNSLEEARRAYNSNQIEINDPIVIRK